MATEISRNGLVIMTVMTTAVPGMTSIPVNMMAVAVYPVSGAIVTMPGSIVMRVNIITAGPMIRAMGVRVACVGDTIFPGTAMRSAIIRCVRIVI